MALTGRAAREQRAPEHRSRAARGLRARDPDRLAGSNLLVHGRARGRSGRGKRQSCGIRRRGVIPKALVVSEVLRFIVAFCYGAALVVTLLSFIGMFVLERGHLIVLAGWAFVTALFFALGRLADLARGNERE